MPRTQDLAGTPRHRCRSRTVAVRVPVATVVAMVADGMSTAEILAELTELEEQDVAQALRYGAAAAWERELPLRYPS
jgi:uncharacterized protein (DUF433 family)